MPFTLRFIAYFRRYAELMSYALMITFIDADAEHITLIAARCQLRRHVIIVVDYY